MLKQKDNLTKVSYVEYRTKTTLRGQDVSGSTIIENGQELLNGDTVKTFSRTTTTTAKSVTLTTYAKIWFNEEDKKCLKIEAYVDVNGQKKSSPVECPTEEYTPESGGDSYDYSKLRYYGKETIITPAGTFNADKYANSETTRWVSENVPLTIKSHIKETVGANGERMTDITMELVRYN
jgi:hypothetical protein